MFRSFRHLAIAFVLGACVSPVASEQGDGHTWDLPPTVAPPRVPADAPMTAERVELGRHLFYDRRLSGNGTLSCASCHLQELAFTDGRARPAGSTGEIHSRSSMSLINVAYRDVLTWANPSLQTLDEQVLVPLFGTDPIEIGLAGNESRVYAELERDPAYRRLFAEAFPGAASPIDTPNVAAALAAFLRSIVSFRSPFDRYRFYGDESAMSAAAIRGMNLFFSEKARCGGCHMAHNVTVDLGLNLDGGSRTSASPVSDPIAFMFHNTGLYDLPGELSYATPNTGLHELTGRDGDVGKFRVPTLRNIAVTAPYMHDGSIATLDEVLDHYVRGGRARSERVSSSIQPLALTADERKDLIAFLQSLTDEEALADPRWSDPWERDPARPSQTSR